MKYINLVLMILLIFAYTLNCDGKSKNQAENKSMEDEYRYQQLRTKMVERQIESRGVRDSLVLDAMRSVPRHLFVPEKLRESAYRDSPLPIGYGQTISQPYIVGFMTEKLKLTGDEKVLEIGTGSGYQAAVLGEIVDSVYTIEIICGLHRQARDILDSLDYDNVISKCGDGYQGWEEYAPFDGIIVTAAPEHVPQPLIDQLKIGGRMVIPVGDLYQELMLITKDEDGVTEKEVLPVRFVPMTGEAMEKEKEKE